MRISISSGLFLASILIFGLTACEPGMVSKGNDFQRKYSAARQSLEQGNYDNAIRSYEALLPNAGPLEPRLRLEYAHALLRAGRFEEAAQVAGALANGSSGSARAAALAVQGTALHESAILDMRGGATGPATVALLRTADAALQEMLALDAGMDPLGTMASRRVEIAQELKRLGA